MNDKTLKETINKFKSENQGNALDSDGLEQMVQMNTCIKSNRKISKERVSKNQVTLTPGVRKRIIEEVMKSLLFSEISQGYALKQLRSNVLGLKQSDYAKLVKISRKTLSEIENNKNGPSVDVVNKAFKPFGLKVGLVPMSSNRLNSLLKPDSEIQVI